MLSGVMSNRTWACVDCGKSYRRQQGVEAVICAHCRQPCEYVHWKMRIPSPAKRKDWDAFWTAYRREKSLIARFRNDPSIKEITLELLNLHWTKST